MDRSTSNETATKIVNTEATDHVGVKARDRPSGSAFSAISNKSQRLTVSADFASIFLALQFDKQNSLFDPEIDPTEENS